MQAGPALEKDLTDFLLEIHEVAVIPGLEGFFGPASRGHIRLAVATSYPLLKTALDRLEAGLADWAAKAKLDKWRRAVTKLKWVNKFQIRL